MLMRGEHCWQHQGRSFGVKVWVFQGENGGGPFESATKIMISPERGMFGLRSDQTLSSIDANQKPETRNQALRSLMILQLFKSLYYSKIIIA